MPKKSETVKEVASKINAHLKRIEADQTINKPHPKYGTRDYYQAGAYAHQGKVGIMYVSYQGGSNYALDEAVPYLDWLDAGNIGRIGEFLDKSGLRDKLRAAKLEDLCFIAEESRRPKFTDPAEKREEEFNPDLAVYADLAKAYYALLDAFSPRIPKPDKVSKWGDAPMIPSNDTVGFYFEVEWHRMTLEQQEAATALYKAIHESVLKAYQRGLDNGRDLLASLARGEIVVGEFEKSQVRKEL